MKKKGQRGINLDRLAVLFCILCLTAAGMDDSGLFASLPDGFLKIVSLGVPAMAVLVFALKSDFSNAFRCVSYLPVLLLPLVIILLSSLIVFCKDLSDFSAVTRGFSKLFFQGVTALVAVSMVYMFGKKAIDYLFYSMVLTNLGIMVTSLRGIGIGSAVRSVVLCIVTFGSNAGDGNYVSRLEINDITFLFGQFLVYYLLFEKKDTREEKRKCILSCALCVFFLLVGLKRVTFAAVAFVVFLIYPIKKSRTKYPLVFFTGLVFFAFSWFYIWIIREGIFTQLLQTFDIDMMGRDHIWSYVYDYYKISPFFIGNGFESVRVIMRDLVSKGIMKQVYLFHNDFLKMYVETGFRGFALWTRVNYLYYPRFWFKKHGFKEGLLYFALIIYMSVTYLTDNTAFYFWVSVGLRLMPTALAASEEHKTGNDWEPPAPVWIREEVHNLGGDM